MEDLAKEHPKVKFYKVNTNSSGTSHEILTVPINFVVTILSHHNDISNMEGWLLSSHGLHIDYINSHICTHDLTTIYVQVAAEDVPELSLKFEVVAVPTFILVKV